MLRPREDLVDDLIDRLGFLRDPLLLGMRSKFAGLWDHFLVEHRSMTSYMPCHRLYEDQGARNGIPNRPMMIHFVCSVMASFPVLQLLQYIEVISRMPGASTARHAASTSSVR